MSSAANPGTPLPVRTPGSRARGRHRRPERPEIPAGAPSLLLAVPSAASREARTVVEEIVSIVRGEQFGIDVSAGYLSRPESGSAAEVSAAEESADALDPRDYPTIPELLAHAQEAELPPPVLVPLLVGPGGELHSALEGAIASAGVEAQPQLTDVLGPHPLLSEAVHVRLSEAGLARADRARLFTINTAADGIVLATIGGEEGVQQAGAVTGVLLAARLAVPVVPAALDVPGSVAAAAQHLRSTGCARPAMAPFMVGPEASSEALAAAAAEVEVPMSEPIGAYAGVARLVLGAYLAALGVEMEQPAQPAPLG